MRELNIYIKNTELDRELILSELSEFAKITEVHKSGANTLSISDYPFVDWDYIFKFGLKENTNFVFLDEYTDGEYPRDRFIDSGLSYTLKETSTCRSLPLVNYPKKMTSAKVALLLDRDGIINIDSGYVYKYSDEIIYPDILEVVKEANVLGIPVAIVTNQAGIARGMYKVSDVDSFHKHLKNFYQENGARIDHIEICPFHKDKGEEMWKFDSLLRKPNPGMHLKALSQLMCKVEGSLMIGDKQSDRINLLGLKTLLLQGDYEITPANDLCQSRQELCQKISNYLNNLLDFS
ncbi:D-glycero-alpha-D-manno-heptose-1,7-bisphosphate 7-phosphatase [Halobacteriovorax marinus]|nr:HAD-IIIA family hydrolase [Halobacteriovorax marinus]